MDAKEIIRFYMEQGVLISPELLARLNDAPLPLRSDFSVLTGDALQILNDHIPINIVDFEKSMVLKDKYKNSKLYDKFIEYILQKTDVKATVAVLEIQKPQDTDTQPGINPHLDTHLQSDTNTDMRDDSMSTQQLQATGVMQPGSAVQMKPGVEKEQSEKELEEYKRELMKKHRIRIVNEYTEKSHKRTVNDFVNYFTSRYKEIEKILRGRQELQNLTSIARINAKKEKDNVALIGFVYDKQVTKNNNLMFTLEDNTGIIKVVVRQNKEELFALAQEIQLDEVIGVTGTYDGLVFANSLFLPDVPLTKELKKSSQEGYFVVIADPQIGSKLFLEKEFRKFISWINAETGSDAQKALASKVKYIFLVGDVVDGVGIYPDQEFDLNIIDITDQYRAAASYLKMINPNIPIIICPGNHDVGRISEPQPKFHDEYSKPLWMLSNIIAVSNPSTINIYADIDAGFDGFDVLLYHGFSFVYYAEHIPTIRQKGAQKRPDLITKYLLQRRHLAPTHTSTLYIPDPKKDYLTIDKVPDFFLSGHIHRASVNNYRNVTCINASCWVSQSDEQERRGLEAQPGRAFIVNMQTREIKVMNFLSKEDQEKESKNPEQSGVKD